MVVVTPLSSSWQNNKQTNKQTKFEGVAAPRQQGRKDQTHRGQTPLKKNK
jgi:hypothetical protein